MILNGGFLNKSSGYYYYVQNIKLHNLGWKSVVVKHDNKIIGSFTNKRIKYIFS